MQIYANLTTIITFPELGAAAPCLTAVEPERDHRIRLRGPHPETSPVGPGESPHPNPCAHISLGLPNR